MAKFRDMRKFVRFVQTQHAERAQDEEVLATARHDDDFIWPPADKTRDKFAAKEKFDEQRVTEICDDTIGFRYLRLSEYRPHRQDHSLILTSRGRHFLMRLGLLRDFCRDNKDWLNPAIAFIVGTLAAGVPFIIYLLSNSSPNK